MKEKAYLYELKTTSLNIIAIAIMLVVGWLTYLIIGNRMFEFNYIVVALVYILWLVIHELLHALGYRLHGAKKENITFGAAIEKGVFYCLCKQEISKKAIMISLLYPLFFIGIVTYIIGLLINSPALIILSIANIGGASGDILMSLFIMKLNKNIRYSEFDEPTCFAIISKEEIKDKKAIGLKLKEVIGYPNNRINKKDPRKIVITKATWIIMIIYIAIVLQYLLLLY